MGDVLTSIVIPEIELIMSYMPNCYFIKSKNFDGSIIPMAINSFNGKRAIVISGDVFDSLYLFDPNFITIYINRKFQHFKVCSTIDDTIQSIVKNESPIDLTIFRSELYYRLLLSIKGSKITLEFQDFQLEYERNYGKEDISEVVVNGEITFDMKT